MAIRLRTVGDVRVALCAVEADPLDGDVYLDDADHYALAAKFRRDWQGQVNDFPFPLEWAVMDTQKVRDAEEEINKFLVDAAHERCGPMDQTGIGSRHSESSQQIVATIEADNSTSLRKSSVSNREQSPIDRPPPTTANTDEGKQ